MSRSVDCPEDELLDVFWPFIEKLKTDATVSTWTECPFATCLDEVAQAEKALWYPLPRSYVLFLLGWNGFNVVQHGRTRQGIQFFCCTDYLSAESPAQGTYPEWADIVRGNAGAFRWAQQPCDMLNFAGDEYGNAYGFIPTAGSELRVAYWNHDGCETTVLADSFAKWLNTYPDTA